MKRRVKIKKLKQEIAMLQKANRILFSLPPTPNTALLKSRIVISDEQAVYYPLDEIVNSLVRNMSSEIKKYILLEHERQPGFFDQHQYTAILKVVVPNKTENF